MGDFEAMTGLGGINTGKELSSGEKVEALCPSRDKQSEQGRRRPAAVQSS